MGFFLRALAIFLFLGSSAHATCTIPVTLANGTLADATQVMQDLNALKNCVGAVLPVLDGRNFGIIADGTTSNDTALAAAATACAAAGTRLILPPGQIKLTGITSITLKDCTIEGAGFTAGNNGDLASYGTTILLTSTTQKPFVCGSNWSMFGINFYWPNQTGAVVYPALISDDGAHICTAIHLDHIGIVNAYDGFVQTSAIDWSNWDITNFSMWAVHDLFKLNQTGDSWRLGVGHFTHGLWANIAGYSVISAYLNTADQHNSILHVTSGAGVTWIMTGISSFAWRTLVKVDAGGNFINSLVDGAFDGISIFADTSAGATACLSNTTFTGAGWASYIPVFSNTGVVTTSGNDPAFNLGAGNVSCHGPLIRTLDDSGPTTGSFMVSAGQEIDIQGSVLTFGAANDGTDYYAAHITANPGESTLSVQNSQFLPGAATTKMHGIKNDVAMNQMDIRGNRGLNLNEMASLVLGTTPATFTGNSAYQTQGSVSLLTSGTGQLSYGNNNLDKPPVAGSLVCGAGATIAGATSGTIIVGSTNPTTSCAFKLPFTLLGGGGASCLFQGSTAATLGAVTDVGTPPTWTVTSSADIHGSQIFWSCPGTQ
jgi:hypothetical protein